MSFPQDKRAARNPVFFEQRRRFPRCGSPAQICFSAHSPVFAVSFRVLRHVRELCLSDVRHTLANLCAPAEAGTSSAHAGMRLSCGGRFQHHEGCHGHYDFWVWLRPASWPSAPSVRASVVIANHVDACVHRGSCQRQIRGDGIENLLDKGSTLFKLHRAGESSSNS